MRKIANWLFFFFVMAVAFSVVLQGKIDGLAILFAFLAAVSLTVSVYLDTLELAAKAKEARHFEYFAYLEEPQDIIDRLPPVHKEKGTDHV